MKIGGADADIAWNEFGPSPDSADSLDDTEIEGEYELSQLLTGTHPLVGFVGEVRYAASKITIPGGWSKITDLELMIELGNAADYVQAIIWGESSGEPGSRLWTGSVKIGPETPMDWYAWSLDLAVSPGLIWVGCKYYRHLAETMVKVGRIITGGDGLCTAAIEGTWTCYPTDALSYKVIGGVAPYQIELAGTPGDYAENGTFTSGIVDLGVGIALNSVKWESQEPSPTSIDTVPPPPKTVSVRSSDTAPTIAKGGGAWADKDVPDMTDPEWGGDTFFNLLATISVGNGPRGVACDETTGKTFVTNWTSGTVSVIHTASNTVSATIGVGGNPYGIACDETAGRVFIANNQDDTVSVIHSSSGTISATISVGDSPTAVACDETAGKTFVVNNSTGSGAIVATADSWVNSHEPSVNYGSDTVLYLRSYTWIYRAYIFFPIEVGMGIESATLRLYCTHTEYPANSPVNIHRIEAVWAENTITWSNKPAHNATVEASLTGAVGWMQFDITALAREWAAGIYPNHGIVVKIETENSSVGDVRAYFSSREGTNAPEIAVTYGSTVSIVHTASNTISATIGIGPDTHGVACDETVGKAFVTTLEDTVFVIHTPSNTVSAMISVGTDPYGVACDEGNGKTFVISSGSGDISVIHTASNTVSATITVGDTPRRVVCDEGVGKTFVTSKNSDAVSVIDSSTNAIIATVSVGGDPLGIDCDESAGKVFVANSTGNSVSVISDVEGIDYFLPYTEYESEGYVSPSHRKRYAQFCAKLWSDVS